MSKKYFLADFYAALREAMHKQTKLDILASQKIREQQRELKGERNA